MAASTFKLNGDFGRAHEVFSCSMSAWGMLMATVIARKAVAFR
jgi:hypothetical protein